MLFPLLILSVYCDENRESLRIEIYDKVVQSTRLSINNRKSLVRELTYDNADAVTRLMQFITELRFESRDKGKLLLWFLTMWYWADMTLVMSLVMLSYFLFQNGYRIWVHVNLRYRFLVVNTKFDMVAFKFESIARTILLPDVKSASVGILQKKAWEQKKKVRPDCE